MTETATFTEPGTCPDCGKRLDSVRGAPNPRTATLQWTARPCGHPIGAHEAVNAGVPGLLIPVTGANLIAAERESVLGRVPVEADLRFTGGQLAWRAWCHIDRAATTNPPPEPPTMWAAAGGGEFPLDKRPVGLLIDAGQYVAAEIDRRLLSGERP